MKNTKLLSKSELEHHHNTQLKSKMSRAEYCRRHNVDYKQLSGHASKLLKSKPSNNQNIPMKSDFIPVSVISKPKPSTTISEFTLTHSDGSQLSWSTSWSPEQVLDFVSGWRAQS